MKKNIWLLILLFCPLLCFAKIYFSNAIFFGDSLTDIGNMPESAHPYVHVPATLPKDLVSNFYVPLSNPVDKHGYKVSLVKVFHLKNHPPYRWPRFSTMGQFPTQFAIDKKARVNRSIIWPEFFLAYAYQDGLTKSRALLPWVVLAKKRIKTNINTSIDYAWSAALSISSCTNPKYKRMPICTRQAILFAWQRYADHRTDKMHRKLLIPGTLKQVQLFLQDVDSGLVKVGPNTIYILWVGGNDFSADIPLLSGSFKQKLKVAKDIIYNVAWNNYLAIDTLLSDPKIKAKHIYIFTLYNTAKLSPGTQRWSKGLRDLDEVVSYYYAKSLHLTVDALTLHYLNANINITPTYEWFNKMASGKAPYKKIFLKQYLGKACEIYNYHYTKASTPAANCRGYLFWDQLHPSMSAEQIIGYLFEQEVKETFD